MAPRKRKKRMNWNRPISGKNVSDWLTWAIRAVVPAIAWLAWLQFQADARLEQGQAVITTQLTAVNQKVDAHTTELQRMWDAIGRKK
jgi:hypothetical protein